MEKSLISTYDNCIVDYIYRIHVPQRKAIVMFIAGEKEYLKFLDDMRKNYIQYPVIFLLPTQQVISNIVQNPYSIREKRGIYKIVNTNNDNCYNKSDIPVGLRYEMFAIATTKSERDSLSLSFRFNFEHKVNYIDVSLPHNGGNTRNIHFGLKRADNTKIIEEEGFFDFSPTGRLFQSRISLVTEGTVIFNCGLV